MKRILLVSILALSIQFQSEGQLWAVPGAKLSTCWEGFGTLGTQELINIGDTIIGNKTYNKVSDVMLQWFAFNLNAAPDTFNTLWLFRKSSDSLFVYEPELATDRFIFKFDVVAGVNWALPSIAVLDSCVAIDLNIHVDSVSSYIFQGNTFRRYWVSQNNIGGISMIPRLNLNSNYPLSNLINQGTSMFEGMYDELFGVVEYFLIHRTQTCIVAEWPWVTEYQYIQGTDSLRPNAVSCQSIILDAPKSVEKKELDVWPNPANDELQIASDANQGLEYMATIYNLTGERVMTVSLDRMTTTVNISEIPNGIYVVEVSNGANQTKVVRKVSVVH